MSVLQKTLSQKQRDHHAAFCARLAPVKDWLRCGAPHVNGHGFNMENIYARDGVDSNGHKCGTAMCIAGAAAQFSDDMVGSDTAIIAFNQMYYAIGIQINNLFYPPSCDDQLEWGKIDNPIEYNKITMAMALKAIDNFEKTCDAKWMQIFQANQ